MHSLSLKFRITALALLVAVIPLSIFQAISAKRSSATLINSRANNLEAVSVLIAKGIERSISQRMTEIRLIAQANIIQTKDYEKITAYIQAISKENKYIKGIGFINADGIVLVSSQQPDYTGKLVWQVRPGVKALFFATVSSLKNEVYVTEAQLSLTGSEIFFMTPVRDLTNGKIIGVLLLEDNLDEIQNIVADFQSKGIGGKHIYVVNKLGSVIVTTNPMVSVFTPLLDLRDQPAMLGDNRVGTSTYTNRNSVVVLAGYSDMSEFGANNALDWSIITIVPMDMIKKPAVETQVLLAAVGLIVVAMAVLIAYFFARSLTLPLQRTVALAKEIRRGNYSQRLESSFGGEIGLLATAINEMSDRVEERTAEIVTRNEKLTSEITERKLAQDRLALLSHKIVRLQEEERKRVARELHDGINQLLVSVKYKIENFEEKFESSGKDAFEDVNKAVQFLDEAIAEVRRVSHALRPSVLDDLGLLPAISNLIRQFSERGDVEIEVVGDDLEVFDRLPVDIETAMYRIVQEALTNIEKHANATKIVLNMSCTNDDVTIRIEDNGDGFSLSNAIKKSRSTQSMGLRNIRERIELLEGSFFIHSDIGKGTLLEVNAPLNV